MEAPRPLVASLVVALLAATTGAFVATEALKLERPPVGDFRGHRFLSPGCECPGRVARLSFRLRTRDAVDIAVVTEDGGEVRTLAEGSRPGRGRVRFRWNGRDDDRGVVPDGAYSVRVRLLEGDRTVTFERPVVVDTRAPAVRLLDVEPKRVAPGDAIEIRVHVDEPSRIVLYADGRRVAGLGRIGRGRETLVWDGTTAERRLAPGTASFSVSARDRAWNRSPRTAGIAIAVSAP